LESEQGHRDTFGRKCKKGGCMSSSGDELTIDIAKEVKRR
jgi:hypothetical protein